MRCRADHRAMTDGASAFTRKAISASSSARSTAVYAAGLIINSGAKLSRAAGSEAGSERSSSRRPGVRICSGYSNDDKSPLIDLLNCIVCSQAMKIEKSSPDDDGMDIIQYRCRRCDRIERVRLFRRTRDALG